MASVLPGRLPAFHVMAKPIGAVCNMRCRYCFYLEKEQLYPEAERWRMPPEVLESFIRQFIEAHAVPEVNFAWQGGEPTVLGVGFFKEVVRLQREYAGGKTIRNAFQTNGTLIDDAWGEFLAENQFLIGLSLDGPEEIHDQYRVDRGGKPTFGRVMRGLEILKKHGVEFNILTCVQRDNALEPLQVYRFLREVGSGFVQFIPIIERLAETPREDGLTLVTPASEATVAPWSVRPLDYGTFLCGVFDEWVRRDVGSTFVQIFDVSLEAWMGMEPSLCVFRTTCGDGLALEHNGDLYSCDHYVYPEYRLGNIMETPLVDMVHSDFQRRFGADKRDTLPQYCRDCKVHFICHGECPKHRFLKTPDDEAGLNYLCEGYKHFFAHVDPYMKFMAAQLRARQAPANVMEYARLKDGEQPPAAKASAAATPGPNEPCPCGSGRKFKKCCGRLA